MSTVAAALMLVLATVTGCDEQVAYAPPPPPKVTVVEPSRQSVTKYLEFTGNTAAINTVHLRARVKGYLDRLLFEDGQIVEKGDLLFVIEQPPYQADVKQAEADLTLAKANATLRNQTAERMQRAVKSGSVSKEQLDEALAEQSIAAADVKAKEAALERAQINLGYTEVRAPFDGRIDRHLVDVGNLVGANEPTIIATVNQSDPIYVYFTMNENDLLKIIGEKHTNEDFQRQIGRKSDQKLLVGLGNTDTFPFEGHFDFASITLDPDTGTQLLRGTVANPNYSILPGLFVRVRAPIDELEAALVVPKQAIGVDQLGTYVMVVNANNLVERRSITTGPVSGDMQVVESGLTDGELVVTVGLLRAIPGREVQPVRKTARASSNPDRLSNGTASPKS